MVTCCKISKSSARYRLRVKFCLASCISVADVNKSFNCPSIRLKKSRFFKDEFILPGLFDFSGAFLGDLKEKLKNLPTDAVTVEAADCKGNGVKNRIAADPSSNGSAPSSSSSSSSSGGFNGKSSTACTVPGHDDSLSDGEIVEEAPAIGRRKEKEVDSKKRSKEESSRSQKDDDVYLHNSDAVTKKAIGLSRYEASKYFITVITVTEGGEVKLAGLTGNLLGILDPGSEGKVQDKDGNGAGKGRVKDDFTIGRSRTNDFNTDDLSVSKSHAVISYFENVGFFLRDLGSKHGTFSAGKRIGITGPGSSEELPVDEKGNVIILSKKPSSSSSSYQSDSNGFKRSNTGMPLADGSIVQFGRVVCRVFKKKQSAVISSR
jgi:FHA domain